MVCVKVEAFVPVSVVPTGQSRLQRSGLGERRRNAPVPKRLSRKVRVSINKPSTTVCTAHSFPSATSQDIDPAEPLRDGNNQVITIGGHQVSFDYFSGDPNRPVILFLQGFYYSRHRRAKANALEIIAKRANYSFLVFDYCGTGRSEGDFVRDGTISLWVSHAVALIDYVVHGRPIVICGAGIGGWIMLHVARMRRNVVGLVGVNASVDFTEDLIVPGLNESQRKEIDQKGFVDMPWGRTSYPIGRALLDDAKKWLCLRGGEASLPITCPVHLLQGLSDEEVMLMDTVLSMLCFTILCFTILFALPFAC